MAQVSKCQHSAATETSDDRTARRGLPQLVVAKHLSADWVFSFATTVQEPGSEVIAEVVDLHRSITLGVDLYYER